MSSGARSQAFTYLKKAGKQVAVKAITFRGVKEPRLRFDGTAVAPVRRLQATLSKSVSVGKTVIVTITAPIRKDAKTGVVLANKIRELLASRRAQLRATIYGNRIQVRVLKGGATRTSRLIGFVHNPEPNPAVLFDVTRSLLACIDSEKRFPRRDCWLIVANQDRLAPVETVRQVCLALRARTVSNGFSWRKVKASESFNRSLYPLARTNAAAQIDRRSPRQSAPAVLTVRYGADAMSLPGRQRQFTPTGRVGPAVLQLAERPNLHKAVLRSLQAARRKAHSIFNAVEGLALTSLA